MHWSNKPKVGSSSLLSSIQYIFFAIHNFTWKKNQRVIAQVAQLTHQLLRKKRKSEDTEKAWKWNLTRKAYQRSPFGAKMWNSHFSFNFVLLIQNTSSEKSLIDYNCLPKIIDPQRNDLSYFCISNTIFFFSFFLLRSIFYLLCCYSIVIYFLFLFPFFLFQ